jgi:hypothetical protein
MSKAASNSRNKKHHRAVFASVGLLAVLAASVLVYSIVERIRDASDLAT